MATSSHLDEDLIIINDDDADIQTKPEINPKRQSEPTTLALSPTKRRKSTQNASNSLNKGKSSEDNDEEDNAMVTNDEFELVSNLISNDKTNDETKASTAKNSNKTNSKKKDAKNNDVGFKI